MKQFLRWLFAIKPKVSAHYSCWNLCAKVLSVENGKVTYETCFADSDLKHKFTKSVRDFNTCYEEI